MEEMKLLISAPQRLLPWCCCISNAEREIFGDKNQNLEAKPLSEHLCKEIVVRYIVSTSKGFSFSFDTVIGDETAMVYACDGGSGCRCIPCD